MTEPSGKTRKKSRTRQSQNQKAASNEAEIVRLLAIIKDDHDLEQGVDRRAIQSIIERRMRERNEAKPAYIQRQHAEAALWKIEGKLVKTKERLGLAHTALQKAQETVTKEQAILQTQQAKLAECKNNLRIIIDEDAGDDDDDDDDGPSDDEMRGGIYGSEYEELQAKAKAANEELAKYKSKSRGAEVQRGQVAAPEPPICSRYPSASPKRASTPPEDHHSKRRIVSADGRGYGGSGFGAAGSTERTEGRMVLTERRFVPQPADGLPLIPPPPPRSNDYIDSPPGINKHVYRMDEDDGDRSRSTRGRSGERTPEYWPEQPPKGARPKVHAGRKNKV